MKDKPQFGFVPLFFLLNKNPNELKSIAIQTVEPGGYYGVYFKEWATGWSTGPVTISKGFISQGQFDFTENLDEAIKHASINPKQ